MEWIGIEDKLPPEDELVLFNTESGLTVGSIERDEFGYIYRVGNSCLSWDFDYNLDNLDITHWMPLPEPPKEEK